MRGQVFCADCIRSAAGVAHLPPGIELHICRSCGRIKEGGQWVEEDYREAAERLVRDRTELEKGRIKELRLLDTVEHDADVVVTLLLDISGVEKEEQGSVRIRVDGSSCPSCSRRSGHYFEATLQIRGMQKPREEVLAEAVRMAEELCSRPNEGEFITSVKSVRGGVDIELSSHALALSVAREIAAHFGTKVLTTRSLYGRKQGREVYRTTHLLRIPMFLPGDYVSYRGRYFSILETGDRIKLKPLEGGATVTVQPVESSMLHYMGGRELEEWMDILSSEGGEVIVQDGTVTRRVNAASSRMHERGAKIRVVKLGSSLFEL